VEVGEAGVEVGEAEAGAAAAGVAGATDGTPAGMAAAVSAGATGVAAAVVGPLRPMSIAPTSFRSSPIGSPPGAGGTRPIAAGVGIEEAGRRFFTEASFQTRIGLTMR
jgi:hypothetical protein